jgi:hypothetical protein
LLHFAREENKKTIDCDVLEAMMDFVDWTCLLIPLKCMGLQGKSGQVQFKFLLKSWSDLDGFFPQISSQIFPGISLLSEL